MVLCVTPLVRHSKTLVHVPKEAATSEARLARGHGRSLSIDDQSRTVLQQSLQGGLIAYAQRWIIRGTVINKHAQTFDPRIPRPYSPAPQWRVVERGRHVETPTCMISKIFLPRRTLRPGVDNAAVIRTGILCSFRY